MSMDCILDNIVSVLDFLNLIILLWLSKPYSCPSWLHAELLVHSSGRENPGSLIQLRRKMRIWNNQSKIWETKPWSAGDLQRCFLKSGWTTDLHIHVRRPPDAGGTTAEKRTCKGWTISCSWEPECNHFPVQGARSRVFRRVFALVVVPGNVAAFH